MWDCIKEVFRANLPYDLSDWMLGIVIGCVVAGIISLIPGGPAGLAFLAGCLGIIGVTLVLSLLGALVVSIIDCYRTT